MMLDSVAKAADSFGLARRTAPDGALVVKLGRRRGPTLHFRAEGDGIATEAWVGKLTPRMAAGLMALAAALGGGLVFKGWPYFGWGTRGLPDVIYALITLTFICAVLGILTPWRIARWKKRLLAEAERAPVD